MRRLVVTLVWLPAVMAQTPPAGKPESTPPADPLDALVADSPFLPGAGARRGATAASAGPLELRSVVFMDGAYRFSIFDQGANKAEWVGIEERGHPFVARSFDHEKDALTVEYQGRTIVLALQPAKMASNAPAQPPPSPTPLPGPGDRRGGPPPGAGGAGPTPNNAPSPGGAPQPPPGVTNAAEAQRLQNLADEIRRRRNSGSRTPTLPK